MFSFYFNIILTMPIIGVEVVQLDRVGPIVNRPFTDQLNQFVQKKYIQ